MKSIVCTALLVLSFAAGAQPAAPSRFEVTPFIGYMRGGSVRVDDSQLTDGEVEVKVEQSSVWGAEVEQTFRWGPDLRLQYLLLRAASQLEDNRKLFGEVPSGPVPPGSQSFTDVSTTYLHAGLMKYFGKGRTAPYVLRPFYAGGIGVTQVSFHEIPLDDQLAPSLNIGAGVQFELSERMALRFETRAFYTHLSAEENTVPITNRDCVVLVNNPCIRTYSFPEHFIQGDITAGFSWKF